MDHQQATLNRMSTLHTRIARLQATESARRGQKSQGWNSSRNKAVLVELRRILPLCQDIIDDDLADWEFKHELVSDLISSTQGL